MKFQDSYFKARLFYNERFRKDYPKESVIVLIAGDKESIIKTKRNIFHSRIALAKAIEKLSECNPKLIVLDIMFFKDGSKSNIVIAEAIKKAGNVIFVLDAKNLILDFVDSDIVEASLSYGGGDFVIISEDDVLRTFTDSVINFTRFRGTRPVAIVAAVKYKDISLHQFRAVGKLGAQSFYFSEEKDAISLPVNEDSNALVNYRYNEKNLPTIPIWKVITGDFEPKLLNGKIALLSTTADVYGDIHITPIGKLPGGIILANIINSLIYSDFLVEVSFLTYLVILCTLAVILAFIFYRTSLIRSLLILIFTIFLSLAISFALFLNNVVWSVFDIIVLSSILYVVILFHKAKIWELEVKMLKEKSY